MIHETLKPSALAVLVWGSILLFLAGCADYASFHRDPQVLKSFQNYEMVAGYHYYYSGRENKPSAIIGIDPSYTFSSNLWTAIEPLHFQKMVDRMFPPGYANLYGADILTPDGRKAGIWYSWVPNYSARFEGRRIFVRSPEPLEEPENPIPGIRGHS